MICNVLSACLHGFYGQDCAEKCHGTCISCNHINGSCVSGCLQGWIGTFCQEGMHTQQQKIMSFCSRYFDVPDTFWLRLKKKNFLWLKFHTFVGSNAARDWLIVFYVRSVRIYTRDYGRHIAYLFRHFILFNIETTYRK